MTAGHTLLEELLAAELRRSCDAEPRLRDVLEAIVARALLAAKAPPGDPTLAALDGIVAGLRARLAAPETAPPAPPRRRPASAAKVRAKARRGRGRG